MCIFVRICVILCEIVLNCACNHRFYFSGSKYPLTTTAYTVELTGTQNKTKLADPSIITVMLPPPNTSPYKTEETSEATTSNLPLVPPTNSTPTHSRANPHSHRRQKNRSHQDHSTSHARNNSSCISRRRTTARATKDSSFAYLSIIGQPNQMKIVEKQWVDRASAPKRRECITKNERS